MTKKVIISVINDLVTDHRVHKVALSLQKSGYSPVLIGRKLPESQPVKRSYKTIRFKLWFTKGVLFYAFYNIRLFLYLMICKADIFLSNDLDTLPANFLASCLRQKPLVYDSHEYFTEVPELINRKSIKQIWLKIESLILPKIKYAYTVNQSIADIYNKKYGIDMKVVRNIPIYNRFMAINDISITLPENKRIIIYQGAINIGRGIKEMIQAMNYIDDAIFLIVGEGDILDKLKDFTKEKHLNEKVIFAGRIPFNELSAYTLKADLGVSLEKNMGLNYYYALPNKIFDYIHAEIPVLAANLPEMSRIVEGFNVGKCINSHRPEQIAESVNQMLTDENQRYLWKENCRKAKKILTWENEAKKLIEIFKR